MNNRSSLPWLQFCHYGNSSSLESVSGLVTLFLRLFILRDAFYMWAVKLIRRVGSGVVLQICTSLFFQFFFFFFFTLQYTELPHSIYSKNDDNDVSHFTSKRLLIVLPCSIDEVIMCVIFTRRLLALFWYCFPVPEDPAFGHCPLEVLLFVSLKESSNTSLPSFSVPQL